MLVRCVGDDDGLLMLQSSWEDVLRLGAHVQVRDGLHKPVLQEASWALTVNCYPCH